MGGEISAMSGGASSSVPVTQNSGADEIGTGVGVAAGAGIGLAVGGIPGAIIGGIAGGLIGNGVGTNIAASGSGK